MDGTISALRCEYVARGVEQAAAAGRLDQIARIELPGVLGRLLDSVYGDDPTVYVLRDVRTEFALRADGPSAGRHWAAALAAAIVTTIAHDPGDGGNLVRFVDEPEYLACYLVDHVRGEAARHWYYRPLAAWHAEPTATAVRALLADRPALPVLVALHRHGMLTAVLDTLTKGDIATLAALPGPPPVPADDLSGLWPLITTAVAIADTWALWTGAPLSALDVARDYRSRAVPDWRNSTALTMIVVDILRHLEARGHVSTPSGPPPPELARFDWLDLEVLPAGLTATAPNVVGQREKRVLRALADLVAASPGLRDAVRLAGPGPRATLLLRAAVTAEHPEWADDGLVAAVLAGLMARWTAGEADPVVAMLAVAADDAAVEESDCAGVLLLLRAVTDLRLPAVLARAGIADALPYVLLAVAGRLTGADPHDPAVRAFAGRPGDISRRWRQAHRLSSLRREILAQARVQGLADLSDDLPAGKVGKPLVDAVVGLLACAVLRAWSRWLGRLRESSPGYLLAHFVLRSGRLRWAAEELVVELDSRPLDVVVSLAGYDKPVESVPWLDDRTVSYRMAAP